MPFAKHKEVINAPYERVSDLLVEKMEKPKKYVGHILHSQILERGDGFIVREMFAPKPVPMTIREKIYCHDVPGGQEFVYEHLNNKDYTGVFRNILTRVKGRKDQVELEYIMDWKPHLGTTDKLSSETANKMTENAVKHMKEMAEHPVVVPEFVRAFYDAVDSKNVAAFDELLAPNCRFRIGNMPEVLGRDNVSAMNREVLDQFESMKHDYVGVYADKGRTFVECWVEYLTHDGSTYLLPFLSVLERSGDKISRVTVYGDISPLVHGWGEPA